MPIPLSATEIIDSFLALSRLNFENLLHSEHTIATDQIIHYPAFSDDSRYTFSLFAFPEETYPAVLAEYFQFCRDYYERVGYRSNLLTVGYRISQDQQSLLSYSYDGPVMTVDPVSTGNPGMEDVPRGVQPILQRAGEDSRCSTKPSG